MRFTERQNFENVFSFSLRLNFVFLSHCTFQSCQKDELYEIYEERSFTDILVTILEEKEKCFIFL